MQILLVYSVRSLKFTNLLLCQRLYWRPLLPPAVTLWPRAARLFYYDIGLINTPSASMFSTTPKSHRSDGGLGFRKDFSTILKSLLSSYVLRNVRCLLCFYSCEWSGCLRKRRLQLPVLNQRSCPLMGSRWPVYWNILFTRCMLYICGVVSVNDVSTAFAARRYHFVPLNGVGVGKSTHHISLPLLGGFQFITNVCSSPWAPVDLSAGTLQSNCCCCCVRVCVCVLNEKKNSLYLDVGFIRMRVPELEVPNLPWSNHSGWAD